MNKKLFITVSCTACRETHDVPSEATCGGVDNIANVEIDMSFRVGLGFGHGLSNWYRNSDRGEEGDDNGCEAHDGWCFFAT
jgi:hypothetical protein